MEKPTWNRAIAHDRTRDWGRTIAQGSNIAQGRTIDQSRTIVQGRAINKDKTIAQDKTIAWSRAIAWSRTIAQGRAIAWGRAIAQGRTIAWSRTIAQDWTIAWGWAIARGRATARGRALVPAGTVAQYRASCSIWWTSCLSGGPQESLSNRLSCKGFENCPHDMIPPHFLCPGKPSRIGEDFQRSSSARDRTSSGCRWAATRGPPRPA